MHCQSHIHTHNKQQQSEWRRFKPISNSSEGENSGKVPTMQKWYSLTGPMEPLDTGYMPLTPLYYMQNELLHVIMDLDIGHTQCYKRWLLLFVWLWFYSTFPSSWHHRSVWLRFGSVRFTIVCISHHFEYIFFCIHYFYNPNSKDKSWKRKEKSPQHKLPMDCTLYVARSFFGSDIILMFIGIEYWLQLFFVFRFTHLQWELNNNNCYCWTFFKHNAARVVICT